MMELVYKLLSLVLSPLSIPGFPEETTQNVADFFNILFDTSSSMIGLLVPTVTFVLIRIVITVEIGIHLYHFVLWILRKIPMLGIN